MDMICDKRNKPMGHESLLWGDRIDRWTCGGCGVVVSRKVRPKLDTTPKSWTGGGETTSELGGQDG